MKSLIRFAILPFCFDFSIAGPHHGRGQYGNYDDLDISPDATCGGPNGYTCLNSGFGDCCSQYGWCGSKKDYCGRGCQSEFGKCKSDGPGQNAASEVSPDATCGGRNGYTCLGSGFGDCCSQYGWCGSGKDYCGKRCQSEFGNCKSDAKSSNAAGLSSSVRPSSKPASSSKVASSTRVSSSKISSAKVSSSASSKVKSSSRQSSSKQQSSSTQASSSVVLSSPAAISSSVALSSSTVASSIISSSVLPSSSPRAPICGRPGCFNNSNNLLEQTFGEYPDLPSCLARCNAVTGCTFVLARPQRPAPNESPSQCFLFSGTVDESYDRDSSSTTPDCQLSRFYERDCDVPVIVRPSSLVNNAVVSSSSAVPSSIISSSVSPSASPRAPICGRPGCSLGINALEQTEDRYPTAASCIARCKAVTGCTFILFDQQDPTNPPTYCNLFSGTIDETYDPDFSVTIPSCQRARFFERECDGSVILSSSSVANSAVASSSAVPPSSIISSSALPSSIISSSASPSPSVVLTCGRPGCHGGTGFVTSSDQDTTLSACLTRCRTTTGCALVNYRAPGAAGIQASDCALYSTTADQAINQVLTNGLPDLCNQSRFYDRQCSV